MTASEHDPPSSVSRQATRRFTVEYDKWMRDNSRIDAYQVRLRTFADGDYFQFFTAVVPGMDVVIAERLSDVTAGGFRRALADVAVEQIKEAISQDAAPRPDDPTKAIELLPDPHEAIQRARRSDGTEYAEGEVIAEFEM